ncbi:MAG TPA: 2-dehydropantoate 2-reductase [Thermoanaerobaculia bacterium]|nr:2-dehydropantoate 2-reductase [Thermoanaerobaculia bacterium]
MEAGRVMRVAVVGAGGVGGYFGGRLANAGIDTTFIVRGATLGALRTRGLRVESINGDFTLRRADVPVRPVVGGRGRPPSLQATDDPAQAGGVDAILMTVKSWQIPEAAARLAPMIGADTVVVPLENGIDAPEVLAGIVGRQHVLGGLCGIVSFLVEPGHIRHIASEPFVMFGELDNRPSERTQRLCDAFVRAGVKADIPPDIHRSMWSKFLFIAPLSAIGALTRLPVGVWRSIPETRAIAERALAETVALAQARGIDLGDDAVARTIERYEGLDPAATSSLQRDVMEGKPSELDAQIGAVVRLARESNVDVPVCELLYHCLLPQERQARNSPLSPLSGERVARSAG